MSKKTKRPIPKFNTPIVETHCHLDYLESKPLAEILQEAQDVGVERFISIAVSPNNLAKVRGIAADHERVYFTQGVHPHEADDYSDAVEDEIRAHGADAKMVAVGEIGLDYFYDHSDREQQRKVFARQLQLAIDLDLPVVIHSREADQDTIDILGEYAPKMPRKGVIHCFTSSPELGQFAVEQGFCLGFTGIATFKKAQNVRDVIAQTPLDRILLETDSPFLAPVPYRGRENNPCYVPFVGECVAEVKGEEIETVLKQCRDNSYRLFFPKETAQAA